jgi:hypothetical protein
MSDRDFGALREDLEALNIQEAVNAGIDQTVDRLADMNRAQLMAGFASDGTRLLPYRSPQYAQLKNMMNPEPGFGNPDFYLTGAFQARIRAERFGEVVEIASYDEKAPHLEGRESDVPFQNWDPDAKPSNAGADRIYGPTAENHNIYVTEDLEPLVIEAIRKQISL